MFGDCTCDFIGFPHVAQVFRRYYDSDIIQDDSPFIKVPKQTRSLTARVDKVLPGSSGGERTSKLGSFVEDLKHQILGVSRSTHAKRNDRVLGGRVS